MTGSDAITMWRFRSKRREEKTTQEEFTAWHQKAQLQRTTHVTCFKTPIQEKCALKPEYPNKITHFCMVSWFLLKYWPVECYVGTLVLHSADRRHCCFGRSDSEFSRIVECLDHQNVLSADFGQVIDASKNAYGDSKYERKPCIFSIITIVYTLKPCSRMKVRTFTRIRIWWQYTHISATDIASISREMQNACHKMRDCDVTEVEFLQTGSRITKHEMRHGLCPVA